MQDLRGAAGSRPWEKSRAATRRPGPNRERSQRIFSSSGIGSPVVSVVDRSDASTRAAQLKASPPIFPSPRLDRLTRAHPATPAVVFLPAVVILSLLAVRDLGVAAGDRFGRRGLRLLDALRVLGAPRRLPLRARGGTGRPAALDDPRGPPRPPERPAPARAPAGLLDPARAPLLRPVRARARNAARLGGSRPASTSATCSTTRCTSRFTTRRRRADSAAACASCTCATTSRTMSAASV